MSSTNSNMSNKDCLVDIKLATDLWWPVKKQQQAVMDSLANEIKMAFKSFQELTSTTNSKNQTLSSLWPTVAHSLAQGYLKDRLQQKTNVDFISFIRKRDDDKLAELLLVAACHHQNPQANAVLLQMIQKQVGPQIIRKWEELGDEAIQDLPSRMLSLSKSGYGRGLPKLLEYSAGCSLTGWLKTCATNYAKDLARQKRERQFPENEEESSYEPPSNESDLSDLSMNNELVEKLKEVLPEAIRYLRKELQSAPQQLLYLNLIMNDKSRHEILELMNIGASRAVELSQLVCGKLLASIAKVGFSASQQTFQTNADSLSPEQRNLIEDALREIFGNSRKAKMEFSDERK